ncbi:MAG: sensor histidine kinase [Bdellovibrionia bacterium]
MKAAFSRFLHTGVDDGTPSHLIDRIVYSNWIYAIGTLINLMGAQANFSQGYYFLLSWNGIYQLTILVCWLLNRKKFYLVGRVMFIATFVAGICTTSAAVGRGIQMEHFLLATAALSFTLFHPTERRWAWLFGSVSILAFFYFIHQPAPIFQVTLQPWQYRIEDLRANQYMYALLIICSLIALSNAYARATKLADEQRVKLFESNKMAALGQMASGVAHEINNPVTAIRTTVELMSRQLNSEGIRRDDLRRSLNRLQDVTYRIVRIVDGMQGFARGGNHLPFVLTPVNQIIDETLGLCQERFLSLGVQFWVTKSSNDATVECRPVQITQALLNLLNNACDAIEPHQEKWIKISVHEIAADVTIHVTNSGGRIPREHLGSLFQPFFTTKEIGRGTGLGLAVSLAMLKEHGGSIHLDADAPNTTFVITLPKQRPRTRA